MLDRKQVEWVAKKEKELRDKHPILSFMDPDGVASLVADVEETIKTAKDNQDVKNWLIGFLKGYVAQLQHMEEMKVADFEGLGYSGSMEEDSDVDGTG